jgi:hypothetical protein
VFTDHRLGNFVVRPLEPCWLQNVLLIISSKVFLNLFSIICKTSLDIKNIQRGKGVVSVLFEVHPCKDVPSFATRFEMESRLRSLQWLLKVSKWKRMQKRTRRISSTLSIGQTQDCRYESLLVLSRFVKSHLTCTVTVYFDMWRWNWFTQLLLLWAAYWYACLCYDCHSQPP